ncbi:MAG: hypothetical protein L0H25_05525 [Micrococcales bacterium]|nr:hypothetical protein [Micrococcales bacterium]
MEESGEFVGLVLDGLDSGGDGAYIEGTRCAQRSLPDDRGSGRLAALAACFDEALW